MKTELSKQFLKQLNNEEVSIKERLHMAYGALITQSLPLLGKEQTIIDWFADCLKRNESQSSAVLKGLTKCLKSDSMMSCCETLDPSRLINAVADFSNQTKQSHQSDLLNCLLLILKNFGFQRFSRFNIVPMCNAVALIRDLMILPHSNFAVDDVDAEENVETVNLGLEDMCECLMNIHKGTQQKNELKVHFVKSFLPAVLKLKFNLIKSLKFQSLFKEIVMPEKLEDVYEVFKADASRVIPESLKAFVHLMTGGISQCEAPALYKLLLDMYVQACSAMPRSEITFETRHKHYISLFYILISVAGISVSLPFKTISASDHIRSVRLRILKELVGSLRRCNIPSSAESDEGVLSDVLVSIQNQLVSGDYPLEVDLIQALQCIFNFYPKSNNKEFLGFMKNVVLKEKKDKVTMKAYDGLMADLVKMYGNLNQLDKFFKIFFHKTIMLSKEIEFSVRPEKVLTSGFYNVLGKELASLTGNRLKDILFTLGRTFSESLVSVLESPPATGFPYTLAVKLMVKLLCFILENSCLIGQNRWTAVRGEVETLASDIQRFGLIVVQSCENDFLLEFLQLVKVLADVQFIVNQYVISSADTRILLIAKPKEKCDDVSNLSKYHGVLPATGWKRVSEFVNDSEDKELQHCWYDMLLQKWRASGVKSNGIVTHLVHSADPDWLRSAVGELACSVPCGDLDVYSRKLLKNDGFGDLLLTVSGNNSHVLTNRSFRSSLVCQLLVLISKTASDKSAIARRLTKLVDISLIASHEAGSVPAGEGGVNEVVGAMTTLLNQWTTDEGLRELEHSATEYLKSLFDLLKVVSPYCLKPESRSVVLLALMGIAYNVRQEEALAQIALDNVLGLLDENGRSFPENLDWRVVIRWLTAVAHCSPLRPELTALALAKVLPALDHCKDLAQLIGSDDLLLAALLETLADKENLKSKSKGDFNELVNSLTSLASSIVKKTTTKSKQNFDIYLRMYAAALKVEFLFSSEERKSHTLLDYLPDYLEVLFRRLSKNMVVEPSSVELIDLTLTHKSEIDGKVIDKLNDEMTRELCKVDLCPMLLYPKTVKMFFESLTPEDFEKTIGQIQKHQSEASMSAVAVSNVCELLNQLVAARLDKPKGRARLNLLTDTLERCQLLFLTDAERICPSVLTLLHSITLSKTILLRSKLLDCLLVVLWLAPTDKDPLLLPPALSVLVALLFARPELVFDRIPAYLQRLRKHMRAMVALSSKQDTETFNPTLNAAMNQVTRIVKMITDQHQKYFTRLAPYLIADILDLIVSNSLQSSTKDELVNYVCSLLTVCDEHGTKIPRNLLPPAATELYKRVYATYTKSFKYTGKV